MRAAKGKLLRTITTLAALVTMLSTAALVNAAESPEAGARLEQPMAPSTRAVPSLPAGVEGEVLSDIFRNAIGTGPQLLSDKMLQITPNSKNQLGAIWSKEKIDLTKDFSLKAHLYLGNAGSKAGDGVTFTLQNDSRMADGQENQVIGMAGEGLGAYSNNNGGAYIRNAISIEFDTYYNKDGMDLEVGPNAQQGHLAFVTPKPNNKNKSGEHSGIKWPGQVFLSNGKWREVEFSWVAATKTLSYYMNETNVGKSSVVVDVDKQFGGNSVYFGFTGSTGDAYAENAIAITQLPQSLEQVASVQNTTQNSTASQEISGEYGDKLLLKTEIKTGIYEELAQYEGSKLKLNLADGIDVNDQTVTIDGQKVEPDRIERIGNALYIKNMVISRSRDTQIVVEAQIKTTNESGKLTHSFELLGKENNLLNKSLDLIVNLTKATKGLVSIKNVDTEGNMLSTIDEYGKVGTNFSFEPTLFPGYTYNRTDGNAQGTYSTTSQTVTFIYSKNPTKADLMVEFLDEDGTKLRENIVKEKEVPSTIRLSEEIEIQAAVQAFLTNNYVLIEQPAAEVEMSGLGLTITYQFQGILRLTSFPKTINFGSVAITDFRKSQGIEATSLDYPLIVEDNRKNKDRWELTAEIIQELTNGTDIQTNSFKYVTHNETKALSRDPQVVYTSEDGKNSHNLSSSWGKKASQDGLKLKNDSWDIPKTEGNYTGKIKWTLRDTIA